MAHGLTDKVRKFSWVLWGVAVLAAIVGWFLDKDPSLLAPVLGWITAGAVSSEAAKIGKRATYKREHHENA